MLTVVRRKPPLPNTKAVKKFGILDDYPDLLNVEKMREITGLSAATIRQECADGKIPAVRIGRRWFIPKALFIDYLMSRGAYA